MKLQENIRYYRVENGYLQKELANLIFVSERTIGHYETGERIPPIDKLYLIANALDVEVNDLLYDKKRTDEDWWHHYFQNRRVVKRNMDERSFKLMMKRTYPEEYDAMKETEDTIEIYKYIFSKSLAQTVLPLCDENTYIYEIYHSEEDGWFISGYIHDEHFCIRFRGRRRYSDWYEMDLHDVENPTPVVISKLKQIATVVQHWFVETYPKNKLEYTLEASLALSNKENYEDILQIRLYTLGGNLSSNVMKILSTHTPCRNIKDLLQFNYDDLLSKEILFDYDMEFIEDLQQKVNSFINLENE